MPATGGAGGRPTCGRAFTDEEVRLATGRFAHGDCIRCHTPRPIFETGIGMNPIRRYHNLEEGNTCMTCHWQEGVDYAAVIAGFATAGACREADTAEAGEVRAIYVAPDRWCQGIGHMLLEVCVEYLASIGFQEATLWVIEANALGRSFYEKTGRHH